MKNDTEKKRRRHVPDESRRLSAFRVVDRILALPRGARRKQIQERARDYRNPFLVEAMLERSLAVAAKSPAEAIHRVRLAQLLIQEQGPRLGWSFAKSFDRLAVAEAHRANALRRGRRFEAAAVVLRRAYGWLEQRQGLPRAEPKARAVVLSLHASLFIDQRRNLEALRLLREAESLSRRAGDLRLTGHLLLKVQNILGEIGELEKSVQALQEACTLLENTGNIRQTVAAHHGLAVTLCNLGRHREAQATLERAAPAFDRCGVPLYLHLRTWVRGRIHQGLGAVDDARRCYRGARAGLLELRDAFDALLVSLDLAGLYLQHGRAAEVEQVAGEIRTLMEHPQTRSLLHEEGRAALRRFLAAAIERDASEDLLFQAQVALKARHAARSGRR